MPKKKAAQVKSTNILVLFITTLCAIAVLCTLVLGIIRMRDHIDPVNNLHSGSTFLNSTYGYKLNLPDGWGVFRDNYPHIQLKKDNVWIKGLSISTVSDMAFLNELHGVKSEDFRKEGEAFEAWTDRLVRNQKLTMTKKVLSQKPMTILYTFGRFPLEPGVTGTEQRLYIETTFGDALEVSNIVDPRDSKDESVAHVEELLPYIELVDNQSTGDLAFLSKSNETPQKTVTIYASNKRTPAAYIYLAQNQDGGRVRLFPGDYFYKTEDGKWKSVTVKLGQVVELDSE